MADSTRVCVCGETIYTSQQERRLQGCCGNARASFLTVAFPDAEKKTRKSRVKHVDCRMISTTPTNLETHVPSVSIGLKLLFATIVRVQEIYTGETICIRSRHCAFLVLRCEITAEPNHRCCYNETDHPNCVVPNYDGALLHNILVRCYYDHVTLRDISIL